jgi:hypothetical protein
MISSPDSLGTLTQGFRQIHKLNANENLPLDAEEIMQIKAVKESCLQSRTLLTTALKPWTRHH